MREKIVNHRISVFLFILFLVIVLVVLGLSKYNEVEALSKYGSRGNEVSQIQEKLKRWGYYNGSIDGIYGSKTLSAVKAFQRKNGLTVDGIAGQKTLSAMGINSSIIKLKCRK